jgi:hypothetical protein
VASPPWFGSSSVLELVLVDDILIGVIRFTISLFARELVTVLIRAVL